MKNFASSSSAREEGETTQRRKEININININIGRITSIGNIMKKEATVASVGR